MNWKIGSLGNRVLRPFGVKLSRIQTKPQMPKLPMPAGDARAHCIIVGTESGGFGERSKVSVQEYFPKFAYQLAIHGVATFSYGTSEQLLSNRNKHKQLPLIIVLVYKEVVDIDKVPSDEHLMDLKPDVIFNSKSIGRIVRNKLRTHEVLSRAGVKMPRLVERSDEELAVVSNEVEGSGGAVTLMGDASNVDRLRYNTEFVDTRREYKGKSYYSMIRALAVGRSMIAGWVKLRPVEEGNCSVHTADTPVDPGLLHYFHGILVEKNREEIQKICETAGRALGPGFYAHDLLLCNQTHEIYLCESGFKFSDVGYRKSYGQIWCT